MLKPMPSPNGSNHERLFILQGRRPSPQMAYDSAAGSYPDARKFFEGGVATLSKWAGENLSDRDIEQLIERLKCAMSERMTGMIRETVSEPAMDAASIRKWRDYGANFARKFAADRAKASASAEQEYFARYPNARRLEASANCTVATTPSAKPIGADASAERAYFERFPHARRLAR